MRTADIALPMFTWWNPFFPLLSIVYNKQYCEATFRQAVCLVQWLHYGFNDGNTDKCQKECSNLWFIHVKTWLVHWTAFVSLAGFIEAGLTNSLNWLITFTSSAWMDSLFVWLSPVLYWIKPITITNMFTFQMQDLVFLWKFI